MTATSTRQRTASGDLEELQAQLAEARAEISELREQIRATARLTIGIGVTAAPANVMASPPKTVTEVCRVHGVGEHHAAIISGIFGP